MFLKRRLDISEETPLPVALALFFYVGHLFCAGWVASSEVFAFATTAMVAWCLWRGLLKPSFHILYVPLALYGLASTVSALVAEREIHSFGESALWGKLLLFPAALILLRNVPRARETALRMVLIFGAMASSMGLAQYVTAGGFRDLEHRITGAAAHVMTLSGLLLPVALTFIVLWIYETGNVWLLAGGVATNLALLITFTRSAWLGWIVGIAVLLILKWPKALAWAVPVAIIAISFAPLPVFSRVISSFDTRQSSNLDRIRMAEAGIEIIKDYPVFGVGPANVKEIYPLYRKHDAPRFRIPHLHNNVIQLLAERGVLALLAYLFLQGLFLRECARAWGGPATKYAEIGVVVVASLGAAGMFEFNFGDTEVFWIMLDLFAIVIAFAEGVGGGASGVGAETGDGTRRSPTPNSLLPTPRPNEPEASLVPADGP